VIATPNLSDKGCIFSGIDLAPSIFLYGKWDTNLRQVWHQQAFRWEIHYFFHCFIQ